MEAYLQIVSYWTALNAVAKLFLCKYLQVVALGVDAYLQMLLRDNFVHTDLHPGNILVRSSPQVRLPFVHTDLHPRNILVSDAPQVCLPFVVPTCTQREHK